MLKACSLILFALLGACGTTGVYYDWDVPTTFRFASITQHETGEIAGVFEHHGLRFQREDTRDSVVFSVEDIQSTWHLARVMHAIKKKADDLNVEVPLEAVTFEYGGLNTSAMTRTSIEISVPRGASACIADGSDRDPWRPVKTDDNGLWTGEVRTDGTVADNDGWVYVAATRDGEFYRYFRVNVLTKQQQVVSFSEVRSAGLSAPEGCSR